MRYDDASQAVSNGHSEPVARPDVDTLPAGSYGPATGNAISGEGTGSGAAGADKVAAAPATITEVQGAGGPAIVANGTFQANGQYGVLSMDAQGNFNYVRNPNTPDGVKDVFNYTIADAAGASASTTLTIDIAQVAAAANGQGVVALPAGVELSDIHINGRDLVISMPDGTQMVIPNGAVFVPEITIGDVQVPASNVAALLVDSEPQPAAGPLSEPGGNWNDPIPPLDPGVPLGDLIPPTEFGYKPPEFQEPDNALHQPPTVVIETPDFPLGVVDASESVFEKGLPGRDGNLPNEPAGSGEIADGDPFNNSDPSETNTGTIVFTAQGGVQSVTIDGVAITQVGQTIQGQYGTMTITGIDLANGQITYTYTLADNTSGDNTADHFSVVVTDNTGDTASATLTVNIVDDVPTARNDTDSLDSNHTATGNVMTGAGTTSGAAGADTVGADNATLTAVSSNFSGQSDASFDASGNLVVHGEFGTLTIMADGSYVYTLDANSHGGGNDVFTYTITDGDGDTSTATLTIAVPAENAPPTATDSAVTVSEEALPSGNHDAGGSDDDSANDVTTVSGSINPSDANGDSFTITLGIPTGTYTSGGETVHWSISADGHTLIGYTGSDPSTHQVVVVTINNSGQYNVELLGTFDDPSGNGENSISFVVPATVDDGHGGTTVADITVTVEDDTPIARNDTDSLDSNHTAAGNVITGVGTTSGSAGADSYGADGAGSLIGVSSNFSGQSDASFDANGNLVVHGEFGTLTIKADGSYVYTLDANSHGGGNDVFTYTITDADGDQTTATLTINVPNQNVAPTAHDSAVTVSEEALPNGNNDAGGSDNDSQNDVTTASGTISPADANNDSLTITLGIPTGTYTSGGQTVHWALSPDGHTLTGYTGNDPTLNHIVVVTIANDGSYSVQLTGTFDDPSGNGENSISFVTTATVDDGHGGTTTADITVTVEDDTPVANNDTDSLDANNTATGNVITGTGTTSGSAGADSYGADGPGSLIGISSNFTSQSDTTADGSGNFSVHGEFGTLVINADGTYTYTLDANSHGGGNDVFTYTITDADGDQTTATLTIDVPAQNAPPTASDSAVTVSEEALPSGNNDAGGSDNDSANDTTTATGTISPADANNDSLTITLGIPSGTYTSGGQTVHWALSPDGHTLTGYTGNNPAANHIVVVTIANDGSYSVQLTGTFDDPSGNGENSISFVTTATVDDGHGGTTTADITVTVEDDTPVANNDTDSLDANNTATGNVITGADTVSGSAGADSYGADGPGGLIGVSSNFSNQSDTTADGSGNFSVHGEFGTLVINADGTYTYTLDANSHGGGNDVFTYTITDADGDQTTATLTINVPGQNAPPTASDSAVTVSEEALASGNHDAGGSDNDSANDVTTATGTISPADANNDSLTITLGVPSGTYTSGGQTVHWALSPDGHTLTGYTGNDPTLNHVVVVTIANDGSYSVQLSGTFDDPSGNGENSISFVTTATVDDGHGGTTTADITVTVEDDTPIANNDSDSIAAGSYGPATGNVITGAGTNEGTANHDSPGADGFGGVTMIASNNVPAHTDNTADGSGNYVVAGQYGTLTINEDGSYSYTRNAGTPGGVSDVFTYTYKDGDGDTVSATLTINIGNVPPETGPNGQVILDDDDVSGTVGNPGGTGDLDPQNTSGTLAGSGGDGPLTFALLATGAPAGFTYALQGNGDLWVMQGAVHVLTITVNASTGAYTVTEVAPIDHPAGSDENNVNFTINYQVTDQDGQTASGTLAIEVNDDTPINFLPVPHTDTTGATATTLDDSLTNNGSATVTSFLNDSNNNPANGENFIGADGFAAVGGLVFTGTAAQDGTQLLDAHGNPLTSHGNAILVTGYGTDTLIAYVESGGAAGYQAGQDTLVFTATLNEGSGYGANSTYTITFSDTVDDGSGISFNSLSSTHAGNVSVAAVGANVTPASGPNADLLISGTGSTGNPGTVNTDVAAIGVDNQSMDVGETARIDFVNNVVTDASTPTGFNFDSHIETTGFIGFIPQVQGSQATTVDFTVYALESTANGSQAIDSNPAGGFTGASIVQVTSVYVQDYLTGNTATLDISGLAPGTYTVGFGVTVTKNADGSVTFHGIQEGDHYGVNTATSFNAIAVHDDSGSFDLGVFSLTQTNTGNAIDLNLGVTATDHDGDTSTGTINLTLTPAGSSQQSAVVNNAATMQSTGSTSDHSLVGSNDNGTHDHRQYAVSQSATLIAAIAAAGLEAEHSRLDWNALGHTPGHEPLMAPLAAPTIVASALASSTVAPTHVVQPAGGSHALQAPNGNGHPHEAAPYAHGSVGAAAEHAPVMTELLHGSAGGHAAPANATAVTAHAVTVPSAQALTAAAAHGSGPAQPAAASNGAQHNEVVSKVVADSLNGGEGHGPSIDGLLNSLPGHDAAHTALEALAAQSLALAFHGAMPAGYGGPHAMLSVEMAMQTHAGPTHG